MSEKIERNPFNPNSYAPDPYRPPDYAPADPKVRARAVSTIKHTLVAKYTSDERTGYAMGAAWRWNIRQETVDMFVRAGDRALIPRLHAEGIIDNCGRIIPKTGRQPQQERVPGEDDELQPGEV